MIDFSTTDEQRALADAAAALLRGRGVTGGGCAGRGGGAAADADDATWHELAGFGALGLLTPAGGGALGDAVALLEALGAGLCPGAIVASIAAGACLAAGEAEQLAAGQLRVTVLAAGYVPWPASAGLVLEVDGERVWRVAARPTGRGANTLSHEPWVAVETERVGALEDGPRFVVAAELGLAAALLGMARTLLDRGAAHARTREQFGRPIGGFQAVAHPLADAWAEVTAAGELVRLVAAEHDRAPAATRGDTMRARLARERATAAALHTAYTVHQAFGGLSFAVETGIGDITTRLRQWSLLLPGPRASTEAAT